MHSPTPQQSAQEIELKLSLPYSDRDTLFKLLKKSAPLARRKSIHQSLLNVYYDTPDQDLRKKRIALRIRQVDSDAGPVWIQTLKTGGSSDSALSLRGEWEETLQNNALSLEALKGTPWSDIDPKGTLYKSLAPCFITRFERTSWMVHAKDHSVVEVALDIGQIESSDRYAPICELELELKDGEPSSLFDLAHSITAHVAVVPASLSKAERGYALAQGTLDMPQRARPPHLSKDQTLVAAGQQVLRETFFHFTKNLESLPLTDNPEVVHQARVGWRRFNGALRLFKPVLALEGIPDKSAMKLLLDSLGHLRDLDVALVETLPLIAPIYASDDLDRQLNWNRFSQSLEEAAKNQRLKVHDAVRAPIVGTTLLGITRYIEELSPTDAAVAESKAWRLESWPERRLQRLKRKLEHAIKVATDQESQHRARILAKRLRYGVESMRAVLPNRPAKRWLKMAAALQGSIGFSRDIQRLHQFAVEFGAAAELAEFLRGYARARE
jgi:inorganic triphosphatase YgiF